MRRSLVRILGLIALGPLIAACSFGGETAATAPNRQPTAAARPVAIQANANIEGRLLFVQDGNLYLHEGNATRQLTSDRTARDPAWSPDGRRIAFVRRETSYSDIYMLDARGGVPTQITFNRGSSEPWTQAFMHEVVWAAQPNWSPDGTQITFLSQVAPPEADPPVENPIAIYSYNVSLVGQRQPTNADLLVQDDAANLQNPAWSPDAALLAYVRVPRAEGAKQIMLYDANTGQTTPFPGIPENTYDPAWSPDGRWLAFAANVNGATDVWVIPHPRIGGTPVRLTTTGNTRAPAWSPSGTQLAFVQVGKGGSNVVVLTLNQAGNTLTPGATTRLTTNGQIDANSGLSWGK